MTAPLSDASLSNLTLSQGTLRPAFNSVTTSYNVTLPSSYWYNPGTLTVTPTASQPSSTINVLANPISTDPIYRAEAIWTTSTLCGNYTISSGITSGALKLTTGYNTIINTVTAPDGVTTATYTINLLVEGLQRIPGGVIGAHDARQIATAYNTPENTGAGIKVGIILPSDAGFLQSDLDLTLSALGLPSNTVNAIFLGNANNLFNPAPGIVSGQYGIDGVECTLDIACVASIVPSATINMYITRITLSDTIIRAVDDGCKVISMSFGIGEQIYQDGLDMSVGLSYAEAHNVVVCVSSGDTGADMFERDGFGVLYPAISPKVIAVGGTALTLNSNGTRLSETASLGGGGVSTIFARPSWQSGLHYTPYNTVTGTGTIQSLTMRGIPDISAAMNGTIFYLNGATFAIGGTSASAPMTAAMLARIINLTGISWSSAKWNEFFYSNPSIFLDITTGNDVYTTDGYISTVGWDPVTGLGVPNYGTVYAILDATLSALTISSGSLSPVFGPNTISYTASVDNGVRSVNVTPIATRAKSTITVNGSSVTSGSGAVNLNFGSNTITIVVTTQGNNTKTYTININRAAPVNIPPAVYHQPYTYSFDILNGIAPYDSHIYEGSLPPELSLVGNTISGTPSSTGVYIFSAGVSDASTPNSLYITGAYKLFVYSQPISSGINWITSPGLLTTTASGSTVLVKLLSSDSSGTFSLIGGSLPPNLQLSSSGTISGIVGPVIQSTSSHFVVRAKNNTGTSISDSIFSIGVTGVDAPSWSQYNTNPYMLTSTNHYGFFIDKDYVSINLHATAPAVVSSDYNITYNLASYFGSLPTGLQLSKNGVLSGILSANVPLNVFNTFTFSVAASDGSVESTQTFQLSVMNANSSSTIYTSSTASVNILNPLQIPQFLGNSNLGIYKDNDNQFIPVTAYDPIPWMGSVTYSTLSTLPTGLVLDPNSGFIHGFIPPQSDYLKKYNNIVINAVKTNRLTGSRVTATNTFTLTIIRSDEDFITWTTDPGLGSIHVGQNSVWNVAATHTETIYSLNYKVVSSGGNNIMPPGLTLSTATGNIIGNPATAGTYTPTIIASTGTNYNSENWASIVSSGNYPQAVSTPQTLTMTIAATPVPYTNIYVAPFLSPAQQKIYNNFITSASIFVPELIFRADDPNFGVQPQLRMMVETGIQALNSASDYLPALSNSVIYPRRLTFGDIKSVKIADVLQNLEFDVVYIEIIQPENVISKISDGLESLNVSFAPGVIGVSTGSLTVLSSGTVNLSARFSDIILCYTQADQGQKIIHRINNESVNGFKFNQLNFTVDRIIIENTLNSTGSSYLLFPNSQPT